MNVDQEKCFLMTDQENPVEGRITTELRDGLFLIGIDRPAKRPIMNWCRNAYLKLMNPKVMP